MVTMTDRRRRLRCTAAAGTGAGCRQCKSDSAIWRLVATTDEADSVESSGATETAATSTEDPLMATAVERNGEEETSLAAGMEDGEVAAGPEGWADPNSPAPTQ